jgi:glycosyltransferase involved in cell wall biosynthesis
MRVLFVSHYFHPEVGAPQTRILETAERLGRGGHSVTVLTGFPNYPDGVVPKAYRRRAGMRERVGEVEVVRAAIYPAPNRGFARRILNHASFAASSVVATPFVGPQDVVVAETPPLFTAASSVLTSRGLRAPLVLNVADLWPESAVQLGVLRNPRAIQLAERLERFAYRHAAAITVPTAGIRASLLARGEPERKVVHLPNAVEPERFMGATPPIGTGRRVVYCGTVGMAQGVGTLVDAAAELSRRGEEFEITVVGDGAERAHLAAAAAARGLQNVRFLGPVERDQVPAMIAAGDIAVLLLRDVPLFKDAVPTKMLEYMAAGRPVIASAVGDAARLIERAEAGFSCPPDDPLALADALSRLVSDPARAREMGANGQRYVRENHSRAAFVAALEVVLERVAQPRHG